MSKMKTIIISVLAAASISCLTACSVDSYDPSVSGIYIKKDFSIIGTEIETLDNSGFETKRYDEASLKEFVENEVEHYNLETSGIELAYQADVQDQKNIVLPVSIEEISYNDNVARLMLHYSDASAYIGFNNHPLDGGITNIMVGKVKDLLSRGFDFATMTDTKGERAKPDGIVRVSNNYIVTVTGASHVEVEGKIVYTSPGVKIVSRNEADTPADEENFIIFK